MINMKYILQTEGGDRSISIQPVNEHIPGVDLPITGVFSLKEANADLGDIVFDDKMNQWEYTGMGDLTHKEAGEIAEFIKTQIIS